MRSRFGSETFAIGIGAAPSHPLGGAGAARTTAVGTDVTASSRRLLLGGDANADRVVDVDFFSTYVFSVVPPMAAQLPPSAVAAPPGVRERGRAVPVQLPLVVVSVLPSSVVPEMTGGDWFAGAACDAASPISARPAITASTTSVPASAAQVLQVVRISSVADGCIRPVLSGRSDWQFYRMLTLRLGSVRSGTGPVAQPVFKIGPVVQPTACSVRLRGRSAPTTLGGHEPAERAAFFVRASVGDRRSPD